MKLARAHIQQFRSIKEVTIPFEPACRVLVGINESGKSNILDALSLLSPEVVPTARDRRKKPHDENLEGDSRVTFFFSMDEADLDVIEKRLLQQVYGGAEDRPMFFNGQNQLTAGDIVRLPKYGAYLVDCDELKKFATASAFSKVGMKAVAGLVKPSAACPADAVHQDKDGKSVKIKEQKAFYKGDFPNLPEALCEPLDIDSMANMVYATYGKRITEQMPVCVAWRYSDQYLLPSKLTLDAFVLNPETCIPLKHMFELAGVFDLKKAVKDAKELGDNDVRDLLDRVNTAATRHVRGIWKECKDVRILIELHGTEITVSVKDKFNRFDFVRRSDGFKRFVSFLLMISARAKTRELSGDLILIDEPEIGLHPSGARFLRDELLQISKNNHVVVATHSIFMIDKDTIERHMIVKKEKEVTSVTPVSDSNVKDEEVLYQALGYSIFEVLEPKNFLFEGFRDKKLFNTALSLLSDEEAVKRLEKPGRCHLRGLSSLSVVLPVFELARRDVIIISDNDDAADQARRGFDGPGHWYSYADLGAPDVVTAEDFVSDAALLRAMKDVAQVHPELHAPEQSTLSSEKGRLAAIKKWVQAGKFDGPTSKEVLNAVKERIFTNLVKGDVQPLYIEVLRNLSEKLRGAKIAA
jgi:hypothetical protein